MSIEKNYNIRDVLTDDNSFLKCPYCNGKGCHIIGGHNEEDYSGVLVRICCGDCGGAWSIYICNHDEDNAIFLQVWTNKEHELEYKQYIQSAKWKQKADEAKERAGHRCQLCNDKGMLHAHHRTYERLGNELPYDITVLCTKHHEKFHDIIP